MRVGIVGLGTAGAAAAAACAARGLSVVGVERGSLASAGARWVNGVPRWMFAAGGIPEPVGEELRASESPFHLVAGWGPTKIRVQSALEVDMRHLVARLQARAREKGAELREGVVAERLAGRTLHTADGRIEADVWIDASGLSGARLLGQPPPDRAELCTAAQEVRRVRDRAGAAAFLAKWGAAEGEVVCFSGVAGGYSICSARVEGDEVGLLTGTIPAAGHVGGKQLLDRFVAEQPWIGELVFGGARAIPVRRAWEVVGFGDRAAIGDAAGQIYAAHGSGIGMQLAAAELLARALAEGRGAWGYNVDFQRAYGGRLAASDLFRRLSSSLSPDDVAALMQAGALSPATSSDAMEQRPIRPSVRALARAGLGLSRRPRLASRLLPTLVRMRVVEAWYALYPSDPESLPQWSERLERLSGQPGWPGRVPG